ncbi:helix-turn-helix domain-containing protein [Bacillus sp. FJAT-45037]|uniref:helix-turn-helix domain-containing protein n=1 Tax=Bacillus sp. FJAT-45037 TaxID=2011007 RepID=UPI000C241AC3|nr:RodZ domain-containing protein [Bacillus sp. FJAT-45037]
MSELGQHLKETREQKGLSLEDLQRTTKIQKRYLQAIEEGRFDTLPGLFYARAFVKTYAEAVGLDSEVLFDQYRSELPNPQKEAVDLPSRSERTKSPVRPTKKSKSAFVPAMAALAFLVIFAVVIWLITQSIGGERDAAIPPDNEENVDADFSEDVVEPNEPVEEDSEPVDEEGSEEEGIVDEEEVPEEEETPPASELTFTSTSGNTSYYELVSDRFDVVIQLNGNSYVDIKNGLGNQFFSGQPAGGEELSYQFAEEEEIEINIGASQNVTLFINDEEVDFAIDNPHQRVNIVQVTENEQ